MAEMRHSGPQDEPAPALYTLGPLIHNPQVVAELEAKGAHVANSVSEVPRGTLVLRSHGVAPQVVEEARAKGLTIVDATCPHVSKAQTAARELREAGYTVVVVGEQGHPEVEGISAYAGPGAIVAQTPAELPPQLPARPVGIVVQTTQSREALAAIVAALRARGIEPEVRDTVCSATRLRQEAAQRLAHQVDVMLVVGGRNSGNTTRLAQICAATGTPTHHIETPAELDPTWFQSADKVGVTAGASTPESQINSVVQALEALG
jgi:4-hydroxy-3-methylbut-2-enyl diphosphate reductase